MATSVQGEDRRTFIGGSDVAAILGFSPWKTPLQVYEEKVGLAPSFEGNAHTARGNRLEAVAAEEYAIRYDAKLQRVNRRLSHPAYPFLTARIDRRILGGDGRLAEIKCPSLGSYSKIKRTGLGEDYIAQFQHYLGLTSEECAQYNGIYASSGEWVIFCADQWDMLTVPVQADGKLIADMTGQLVDFWMNHVLKRVPPSPTDDDRERLEITRSEGTATLYKVTAADDADLVQAAHLLREARAVAVETEAVLDEAKAQVKALLGDRRGVFEGPDFRLSYTETAGRSSFDQKALAKAKPLDRLAVGALLAPLFEKAAPGSEVEQIVASIGKCDIDLTQFQKRGESFPTLRPTFVGE